MFRVICKRCVYLMAKGKTISHQTSSSDNSITGWLAPFSPTIRFKYFRQKGLAFQLSNSIGRHWTVALSDSRIRLENGLEIAVAGCPPIVRPKNNESFWALIIAGQTQVWEWFQIRWLSNMFIVSAAVGINKDFNWTQRVTWVYLFVQKFLSGSLRMELQWLPCLDGPIYPSSAWQISLHI